MHLPRKWGKKLLVFFHKFKYNKCSINWKMKQYTNTKNGDNNLGFRQYFTSGISKLSIGNANFRSFFFFFLLWALATTRWTSYEWEKNYMVHIRTVARTCLPSLCCCFCKISLLPPPLPRSPCYFNCSSHMMLRNELLREFHFDPQSPVPSFCCCDVSTWCC